MTNEVVNENFDERYRLNKNDKNDINKNNEIPFWKICLKKVWHFTVEPIVLIAFISNALTDALCVDLITKRTCTVTYDFTEELCNNNITVNRKVQLYASNVLLAKLLIEALCPAVISLFVGSWMDIHGRKPFLILPVLGMAVTYAIWLGLTYFKDLTPYYFLIASIPISLGGGLIALQASAYSYLADTSTAVIRAIRLAILALMVGLGMVIGTTIANAVSYRYVNQQYLTIFGTAIILLLITVLCTIFLLPETIQTNRETILKERVISFFNLDHIKESIRILLAKKPRHGRTLVILLIPVIVFSIIIEQGENAYLQLVAAAAFKWTKENYNSFRTIMTLVAICVGVPGLIILKRGFKITELTFMFIVMIMQLASSLTVALAKDSLTFYIGRCFGNFIELIKAVAKTKISFLVLSTDIGKIFAIISTAEAIAPLIASPLYAAVYKTVIESNPLNIFFMSTALSILVILILIIIKCIHWKYGIVDVRPTQDPQSI